METTLSVSLPWTRRWTLGKNRYDRLELAGAFGDLGTLIPFVVGYVAVMKIDPLGILFMFGLCKVLAGLYYKTPVPIQHMKAIGGAAIASGGGVSTAGRCWPAHAGGTRHRGSPTRSQTTQTLPYRCNAGRVPFRRSKQCTLFRITIKRTPPT